VRSRYLFHVCDAVPGRWPYAPASLASEGFVHASFKDAVEETTRVHFAGRGDVHVLCIDPRRVGAKIAIAATPRGPMPHAHGPIPEDAVVRSVSLGELASCPDAVVGTRFGFVAFRGMTLLDLVGVHDPISRIAGMGFDATTTCEVFAAHEGPLWSSDGATYACARVRPDLGAFDVLVVPGGPGARDLAHDAAVITWLRTFPTNRLAVSVCTGALLLGAAGRLRGKRATTHASALDRLADHGATAVTERVVDEGDVITAGGVTSGLDAGLHVVREVAGRDVFERVAKQMEWRG
jgi:cyclohexyl-isocyanide hydratase